VWHAYLLLPLLLLLPLRWQSYAKAMLGAIPPWADLTKLLLLSLRWQRKLCSGYTAAFLALAKAMRVGGLQSYARAIYARAIYTLLLSLRYACWRAAKLCAVYII
jgi:hypothetical protein